MHKISNEERERYYLVYKAIFGLTVLSRKNKLLTALGGGFEYPWRVVGITPAALDLLATNDYKYIKGKICRAHRVDRIKTSEMVFNRSEPLPIDDFFQLLWANDETIISTKAENKSGGPSHFIPIDYKCGLFLGAGQVGWKHQKEEIEFLRKKHREHLSSL